MSIAVGQKISAQGTSSAASITTGSVTTAASGSTFVIFVAYDSGCFSSISDSKGNTYTQIQSEVNNAGHGNACRLYYCQNGTGGAGHTATLNMSPSAFGNVHIVEITGGALTGILDQAPAGLDDGASPFTSNTTGTTAQANELVLAFTETGGTSGPGETLTWGNSFTQIDGQNDGSFHTSYAASLGVTSTGTYQSTFTSNQASEAITFIATFKEAAGGASVVDEDAEWTQFVQVS